MLNYLQHMGNINQRKLKEPSMDIKEECWVNYSTEALQPVTKEVTEVLFEIADEMGQDIKSELFDKNIDVDFHIIGSLASNTHIHFKETVDLVILYKNHEHSTTYNSIEDIILLRNYTKRYLKNRFPEALIDNSQPLALEISIKSLPCKFCYYFGTEKTNTNNASGIFSTNTSTKLLNFKSFAFEESNPIKIKNELTNKDIRTNGNTKTLIRLLKNLKADAFEHVSLTGYQISSIICSMEDYTLSKPSGQLLFLLLEVSLFLKKINDNPFAIRSVKSPDDYPLINSMNEESFKYGVNQLKAEIDSLIKRLVLEIDLYTDIYSVTINH